MSVPLRIRCPYSEIDLPATKYESFRLRSRLSISNVVADRGGRDRLGRNNSFVAAPSFPGIEAAPEINHLKRIK